MQNTRKHRVFEIIQIGYDGDWISRGFDLLIILMILSNLFVALFETFDASQPYLTGLANWERITVVFFTVEYALRLWTADYLYPRLGQRRAMLRYVLSFNGVIDLCAFLFYYLPFFFPSGVVAFRMFRIVRIFRLFRINAYYDALNVISDVIKSKRDQLLSSIFIILVLMMAASLCMYSLEHSVQPDVFQNAFSGFWWAVSTLLTVGYGDIYPITVPGRIFGICITFLGVGMVAIPTGILSAGFVEQYARLKTLRDESQEDVHFISSELTADHAWHEQTVAELPLPPGTMLALIQREGEVVVPHGDTVVLAGDRLVLAAPGFREDAAITLKEVILREHHPWVGLRIAQLDISRRTLIVLVRREGRVLIPNGQLQLQQDDFVLLYTKRLLPDATPVQI